MTHFAKPQLFIPLEDRSLCGRIIECSQGASDHKAGYTQIKRRRTGVRKALPRITASADELQRRMQSERDLKHMTHAHIRFLLRGCMTLLFFSTLTAQAHDATYYVAQNGGADGESGGACKARQLS